MLEWIIHDSHHPIFREPFGSVPCGTAITLRLQVKQPIDSASLLLHQDGQPVDEIVMKPAAFLPEELENRGAKGGSGEWYEAVVLAPQTSMLLWYSFIVRKGGDSFYYSNVTGKGGHGGISGLPLSDYQITVYRGEARTPNWFKDSVMYQIFVDRFYNGNPGGKVSHPKKGSVLHAHWDDDPLYIRNPETREVICWDFFGGNLAGVKKKLKYLKELGVTVIYFNPLFESPSNHKYDTGDYLAIDPMFGDNELFRELCEKAEKMGISVILDGVFSHTGSDSVYFNKKGTYPSVGAYQSKESPYYSWYLFTRYPDSYECWWDIHILPNVNEMEPGYLDFIVTGHNSVLKTWQRAGARGWRLDVADELPDEFIQQFRSTMKREDPESVLIGEVWEDATNKISYGRRRAYLMGDELDSVMNYPFRSALLDFITGKQDARAICATLMSLYENYPPHHFYTAMNLLGSHDVTRVLTVLRDSLPPDWPVEDKINVSINQLKLLVLWQMTFPGVPCIYYGDEAGLEGGEDPLNRRTYPWGKENQELLAWYKKTIALRHANDVLKTGEWRSFYSGEDVYGYIRWIAEGRDRFGRERENNLAILVFNRHKEAGRTVTINVGNWHTGKFYDALDLAESTPMGHSVFTSNGRLTITVPPISGKVLFSPIRQ
ncbi:glycoside hydrolase family 13 protein [Aneurinibacillus terranovensis]|uniref:glycoside hydrolase family 13 protein n=1 Tax=Aneurinibacillus terranovensis TaxID=278991 RepID=UPI000415A45A|nr:glycoside hydrolase family 13 protein [Aneurinibacillus terranovensis]